MWTRGKSIHLHYPKSRAQGRRAKTASTVPHTDYFDLGPRSRKWEFNWERLGYRVIIWRLLEPRTHIHTRTHKHLISHGHLNLFGLETRTPSIRETVNSVSPSFLRLLSCGNGKMGKVSTEPYWQSPVNFISKIQTVATVTHIKKHPSVHDDVPQLSLVWEHLNTLCFVLPCLPHLFIVVWFILSPQDDGYIHL